METEKEEVAGAVVTMIDCKRRRRSRPYPDERDALRSGQACRAVLPTQHAAIHLRKANAPPSLSGNWRTDKSH
jgi:hypothetical protein